MRLRGVPLAAFLPARVGVLELLDRGAYDRDLPLRIALLATQL